ncbi:hypothetical protein [Dyadobacter psychrophilus]|uniref:Restriction endonuclease n=1 Tax=Dyadobacter psychrophilus TaxID=651661 RepID=A0A1T5HG98_9BACT|nr:hypothetical protein [Dyadobacter psychrophilus]SKC19639.1 hypothetical protein SAMN05660293_05504 [Dyadobacter psychrophilus]
MLWRLHIRPDPKNGKTHDDVVDYCIKNNISGIGWPVSEEVKSPSEYEQAVRKKYNGSVPSVIFANKPVPGEYIWARDLNGKYYLGCIKSDWFYSNDPLHIELDIPNQRECEWIEIGSEENIPGKIIACFRPAKSFQAIHEPLMHQFTKWAFSREIDRNKFETDLTSEGITEATFFKFIGADDCEDVVGLYLQKIKGYCIIPSSCKPATIGYEFILKHSITSQTAVAQVKQGNVGLDERLRGIADHIYLFSTNGKVQADSDDVTVLSASELFYFVCKHRNILPSRINYWLDFLT